MDEILKRIAFFWTAKLAKDNKNVILVAIYSLLIKFLKEVIAFLAGFIVSILNPKLPKSHQSQDRTDNLTLCQPSLVCIPIL